MFELQKIEEEALLEFIISIDDLKKSYSNGSETTEVLKGINLQIRKGEFTVIVGLSGSGKSTLLNIIGGIERSDEGSIEVNEIKFSDCTDKDLEEYRKYNVGFIFQSYHLISNFTAEENIEIMSDLVSILKPSEVLESVGILEKRDKYPYQLSGGEQQRVAIARALAKKPKLLLCDEPTGALDFETGVKTLELIKKVAKENDCTIIMVTHNYPITQIADRIIEMRSGKIIKDIKNKNIVNPTDIKW